MNDEIYPELFGPKDEGPTPTQRAQFTQTLNAAAGQKEFNGFAGQVLGAGSAEQKTELLSVLRRKQGGGRRGRAFYAARACCPGPIGGLPAFSVVEVVPSADGPPISKHLVPLEGPVENCPGTPGDMHLLFRGGERQWRSYVR